MNIVITEFLHIIDIFFLAIFFYIFSVGIFQLFIGEHELAGWLHLKTIENLKEKLASMIVLILTSLFAKEVALWDNGMSLLYSGIGIAVICGALILFIYSLRERA